jgi:uncharacterized protein with PIN domain
MRLLCDEMLGRLARWLRAAGHDAELVARGTDDRDVMAVAVADDRLLLTRDRGFLERKAATGRVIVLESDTLPGQARELRQRIGVDWLHAPFTRCVVDNTPLHAANAGQRAAAPHPVGKSGTPVTACPTCRRIYWVGDHHRRMRARLERWATST